MKRQSDPSAKNSLEELLEQTRQEYESIERDTEKAKTELRNLTAKIEAKQGQLREQEASLEAQEAASARRAAELEQTLAQRQEELQKARRQVTAAAQVVADAKAEQATVQGELGRLNSEIAERHHYQEAQEAAIDQALTDGNNELRSLAAEVSRLGGEKEGLLRQLLDLKQQLSLREASFDDLGERLEALQRRYDEVSKTMTGSLSELKGQISDASEQYQQILEQTEERLHKCDVWEQELAARQRALDKTAEDLSRRERRLRSNEAIYGIS